MNTKIQILLAVVTAVTDSFLQTPSNHFQMTFNSTFLNGSEKLFRPIVIPNATVNSNESPGAKENELVLKKILQPEESTLRENYLSDEPKAIKFSSRYSTNQDEPSGTVQREKIEKSTEGYPRTIQTPNSERNENSHKEDTSTTEIHKSFLNSSIDSEEEKDYIDERREAEESEILPTTNEPYSELQRSTSFRSFDEDHGSYETTSPAEEEDSSEEDGSEDKRSVEDYDNSGSKNYHSIQTPLESIKYRGAHSYGEDFERLRARLIGSIRRRPNSHNWPYSRAQVKEELEKLNEISDSDESYEKALKGGKKEEVKSIHNPDLESAVEKDELKFDRNKKYNYVEERNRRKQQQKGLIAEEEKDDSIPLLETLKQYALDKEHPKHQPKVSPTPKQKESVRSTNPPHITTPKDIFRTPKKLGVSSDLTLNFQGREFLGPVVFDQNKEQKRINAQRQKPPHRPALKGLEANEKLDQGNPSNQRFQKSLFGGESQVTQSFNHLEESNEMYNAILANIQSVFGLRTQPLKSGSGPQQVVTEASLAESKSLTWSSPLRSVKVR